MVALKEVELRLQHDDQHEWILRTDLYLLENFYSSSIAYILYSSPGIETPRTDLCNGHWFSVHIRADTPICPSDIALCVNSLQVVNRATPRRVNLPSEIYWRYCLKFSDTWPWNNWPSLADTFYAALAASRRGWIDAPYALSLPRLLDLVCRRWDPRNHPRHHNCIRQNFRSSFDSYQCRLPVTDNATESSLESLVSSFNMPTVDIREILVPWNTCRRPWTKELPRGNCLLVSYSTMSLSVVWIVSCDPNTRLKTVWVSNGAIISSCIKIILKRVDAKILICADQDVQLISHPYKLQSKNH